MINVHNNIPFDTRSYYWYPEFRNLEGRNSAMATSYPPHPQQEAESLSRGQIL